MSSQNTLAGTDVVDSSSTVVAAYNHDVFISYRGDDARNCFSCHLASALELEKIKIFRDDRDMTPGDEIWPTIRKAIEISKLFVIIFSENYASSSWCLNELVYILECRQNYKQIVLPVFYNIDPSNVRHQEGSYKAAFEKHAKDPKNKSMVPKWRDALTKAANIAGRSSSTTKYVWFFFSTNYYYYYFLAKVVYIIYLNWLHYDKNIFLLPVIIFSTYYCFSSFDCEKNLTVWLCISIIVYKTSL